MLTEQQLEIVQSFGKGQAVIAGAGCGKTTTLVAKCLALMKRNPQARFCAVSFTEKSVRDLRKSLSEGFHQAQQVLNPRSHWIKTIHGLCSSIIQEFPAQAGLQGGERILIEEESRALWKQSLDLLWSQNENQEISDAAEFLMRTYSRAQLESLLLRLRALSSFGVEDFILKLKAEREDLNALWMIFQSVFQRYRHYKDRDGWVDFNDLEIFAARALEDQKVRKYYQEHFDLVLVDEFQDTNPLQGKILEAFVRPGYSNLCIVGDPKQSIYRFRDADVSVFTELAQKVPLKHLLDRNYRSTPEIISFVNQVCESLFSAYDPLIAGRNSASNSGGHSPEEDKSDRVTRLAIEDENTLAKFLKSEIEQGRDLSEYVILTRSIRSQKTQKFLSALESFNIPFLLGTGGQFYEDPRVQELVAFLKGWISPGNSLSQVAALRAPWIGVSDQELLTWKENFFDSFFRELKHPIAKVLSQDYFSKKPLRPGEVLEKIYHSWSSVSEEMVLPLVTLWHKAEELSSRGRRFEEIVSEFTTSIEEARIEKEIPPPAKKGTVRVLTIHGSKGLQFPRVILLDFQGPQRKGGKTEDLIWDRTHGVHLFVRDEDGVKEKKNALNQTWSALEKAANVAESKRVFYVALTRAQEELILVWPKLESASSQDEAAEIETDVESPFIKDDWRAWIEATQIPPEKQMPPEKKWSVKQLASPASDPDSPDQQASSKKDQRQPLSFSQEYFRARHSPTEWMILNQCPLRYQKRFIQNLKPEVAEIPEISEVLENKTSPSSSQSAQKGERIHALIEKQAWDELELEFEKSKVKELKRLLETPETTETYSELGFEIPLSRDEALVGMMDRLEVNRTSGTICVRDFKWTDRSSLKSAEKTAEELKENYLLQLQLYIWAGQQLVADENVKNQRPLQASASLIHITENSLQEVWIDPEELTLEKIENKINKLFILSKKTLQNTIENGEKSGEKTMNLPIRGRYCRYCEFQITCPAPKS